LFADEQDGREDSTAEEKELAGQEDAGNVGAENSFGRCGIEVDANVVRSEDLGNEDGSAEDKDHSVEDDRERAFPFHLVVIGAVAVEDRDEGDGGGSADEEIVDKFGKKEGYVVGVGLGASSEAVGDELFAHKSDDARGKSGKSEQEGGGGRRVTMRGSKEIERASARSDGRIGVFIYSHGLQSWGWLI